MATEDEPSLRPTVCQSSISTEANRRNESDMQILQCRVLPCSLTTAACTSAEISTRKDGWNRFWIRDDFTFGIQLFGGFGFLLSPHVEKKVVNLVDSLVCYWRSMEGDEMKRRMCLLIAFSVVKNIIEVLLPRSDSRYSMDKGSSWIKGSRARVERWPSMWSNTMIHLSIESDWWSPSSAAQLVA